MCPELYVGVGSIFCDLVAAWAKRASNVQDGDIKADVEWFHRVLLVERGHPITTGFRSCHRPLSCAMHTHGAPRCVMHCLEYFVKRVFVVNECFQIKAIKKRAERTNICTAVINQSLFESSRRQHTL